VPKDLSDLCELDPVLYNFVYINLYGQKNSHKQSPPFGVGIDLQLVKCFTS